MKLFTSTVERNFWIAAFVVIGTIYATLALAGSLVDVFLEKHVFTYLFVGCFVATGIAIVGFGISNKAKFAHWLTYLAIFIGLVMMFTRSGISPVERTHLFEYGLVGVLIFNALKERLPQIFFAALFAFILTSLLGIVDESIQYFLPTRVFDGLDILRNTIAAFIGVFVNLVMVVLSKLAHPKKEKPE